MLIFSTRIISIGLVPLTIAPFAAGSLNPVMDAVLCSLLVVHSHVGFQYVAQSSSRVFQKNLAYKLQGLNHRLLPGEACAQDPIPPELDPARHDPYHRCWPVRVRDERRRFD